MRFKPSIGASVGLGVLCGLFLSLGGWQTQRATEKELRVKAFDAAGEQAGLPPVGSAREFTRVTLQGDFDSLKHILADNQVLNGQAGVHVYTPFKSASGPTILVNRGWLPLGGDRSQLPEIGSGGDNVSISGYIGPIPSPGRQLGITDRLSDEQWPQLVTYPDLDQAQQAMDTELYPMVLFLDRNSKGGFQGRDWSPVFMTPARHRAYAFQWFALAAACLVIWTVLAIHRGRPI